MWQKALSDFYVEYELLFNLDHPEDRLPILSELHMHIQDAFNEQGVQIMSPHFEGQPNEKVFVPKSLWFPKPVAVSTGQPGADREGETRERKFALIGEKVGATFGSDFKYADPRGGLPQYPVHG